MNQMMVKTNVTLLFLALCLIFASGVAAAPYDYDGLEREMQAGIVACERHGKKKLCQAPCRKALTHIATARAQGTDPESHGIADSCRKNVKHIKPVVNTADDLPDDYRAVAEEMNANRGKCKGLPTERLCLSICGKAYRNVNTAAKKGLPISSLKQVPRCRDLANGASAQTAQPKTEKQPTVSSSATVESLLSKSQQCEAELKRIGNSLQPDQYERYTQLQQCQVFCAGAAQYVEAKIAKVQKSIEACESSHGAINF